MVATRNALTREPDPGAARQARLAQVTMAGRLRAPILEALARHATIGMFLSDPRGSAYFFNREACRISGLRRARALGHGWTGTVHPEDRERVLRQRERAVTRGAMFRGRLRFVHRDGRIVQADVVSVPVRDRGQLVVRVGMLVEVVDRMPPSAVGPHAPAGRRWDDLSPQERRVLQLVVEGRTNKQIASALQLSDKTVKNYLSSAFQKLHVERRSQAAAVFARRGSAR
jgi:PAS domain S-box-containing protein